MKQWQMAAILALGAIATLSLPSKANTANPVAISCKTNTSTPTVTLSLNQEGTVKNYTVLKFLPQYFSATDAVQNCQHTAQSLQSVYATNNSYYLTTDKQHNQSVVCVVERRGIGCNHHSAQVLFNFLADNPSKAFYEMLGGDFKQAQRYDVRTVSRTYTATKPSWWPF
jgi:hypothetical protein